MRHEFLLPDIGEGLTDAEIVAWQVAVGDEVLVDQPIVDVETAKITVEITSTHTGTILDLAGPPGTTINVGDMLFVVGQAGESQLQDGPAEDAVPKESQNPQSRGSLQEQKQRGTVSGDGERRRAMPIVRKLAAEGDVDLESLEGTGPDGVVTRSDVQNAIARDSSETVVPMSRTRQSIAQHMTESWTTIPHVTVQAEVRADALLAALRGSGTDLPMEALVAAAALPALKEYREFNAVIRDNSIAYRSEVNLGFAVDTENGLIVVVVHNAETLSTSGVATEFSRLVESAHTGTLVPRDVSGQTFTISNIGALGGGHGTPIIPMGTSAILSIGRAKEAPVVEQGAIKVGVVAPIDLSYDHRLIDGALGQRFLTDLVANLEQYRYSPGV